MTPDTDTEARAAAEAFAEKWTHETSKPFGGYDIACIHGYLAGYQAGRARGLSEAMGVIHANGWGHTGACQPECSCSTAQAIRAAASSAAKQGQGEGT